MLNALTTRGAKLATLGKQLDQVTDKATSATDRLDDISRRLATLDGRTRELEDVDKRIEALKDAAKQAELTTQTAIGPNGELHKHREAVQHLSSQALQTRAVLDTLKKEQAAMEELRGHLRDAEMDVKSALGHAGALKGELDQVRSSATSLQQDYAKIRETSREAREDTNAAMATVKDVEKKLGPLAQLHEISQSTDERLTALNALAEHVSRKAKALESQQQAVEHAVVQANRVNEMVWSMDVQIGKLNEGMKQAAKAEETIGRIERLSLDAGAQLETGAKLRQEAERETAKLTKDAGGLLEMARGQVDVLLSRIAETDERIASIDARRKQVHEVQTKANAIVSMLNDVNVNLEMLGEQTAVVSHVAEKAAQLEFMLQEARNTTRTLQHEPELAARIELSIKQVRSRTPVAEVVGCRLS
jgi:chromosome segregation ATPase